MENITECDSSCRNTEKAELIGLYQQTGGTDWRRQNNWLNNSVPYCEWEGVLCHENTNHVIAITLETNNLKNNIGSTLSLFQYLLGVCLESNEIEENINILLSSLPRTLIRFNFAYNRLSGRFPDILFLDYPHLQKLQISGNRAVYGELTQYIGTLSHLQVLSLGKTSIRGSMHPSIRKLKKIWFLDLEVLFLTGKLSILKNMTNLQYVHLMSNQISSSIPEDFGSWFPKLVELLMQNSQLSGQIPDSLGNLTQLQILNLAGNRNLTGRIAASYSNLKNLQMIDVSETGLQGLEKGLKFNSPHLTSFVASGNSIFSCSLKNIIDSLSLCKDSLMHLDLSRSNIFGKFDDNDIFSFTKLAHLNLADNSLTGTLPDPITSLHFLVSMNISNNNLTGALPTFYLTKLEMLVEVDVRGNPYLKGIITGAYMKTDYSMLYKKSENQHFSCPLILFHHNNALVRMDPEYYDRQFCQCDTGYYGLGGYCRKCMPGGKCSGGIAQKETIIPLYTSQYDHYHQTTMQILTGYWPFPSSKNVSRLLKCQSSKMGDNVCNPQGIVQCRLVRNYINIVAKANDTQKVSSGFTTECKETNICAKHHAGRLCSICNKGCYKSGIYCIPCSVGNMKQKEVTTIIVCVLIMSLITVWAVFYSGNNRKVAIVLMILEVVAAITVAGFGIVPGWVAEINILILLLGLGGYGKSCKGLVKTAIFYVQVIDSLIATSDTWPESVYIVKHYVSSVFNLQFSGLACFLPQVYTTVGRMLFLIALPLVAATLVWGFYVAWYLMGGRKREDGGKAVNYKCRHACIVFLNLAYFPIVKSMLSAVAECESVENISYMQNYVWINCGSKTHRDMLIIAGLSIPFYVVGVPLCFCLLLFFNRGNVKNGDPDVKQWLGSIFVPYQADYRVFMEPLLLLRRLFVALLISVIPNKAALQTFLIASVLVIAVVAEARARPFAVPGEEELPENKFGLENAIEIWSLSVLLVSFIAVRFKESIEEEFHQQDILFWMILVLNMLFILTLVAGIIKRLSKREEISPEGTVGEGYGERPRTPITGSEVRTYSSLDEGERSRETTPLIGSEIRTYSSLDEDGSEISPRTTPCLPNAAST